MRIEVINRETREHKNVMHKDFTDYSQWLSRAANRGYTVSNCGTYLYIHDGSGKNDFRVYEK